MSAQPADRSPYLSCVGCPSEPPWSLPAGIGVSCRSSLLRWMRQGDRLWLQFGLNSGKL